MFCLENKFDLVIDGQKACVNSLDYIYHPFAVLWTYEVLNEILCDTDELIRPPLFLDGSSEIWA